MNPVTESPATKSTRKRSAPVEGTVLPAEDRAGGITPEIARGFASGSSHTEEIRTLAGKVLHLDGPDPRAEVEEFIWARLTRPFPDEDLERLPKPLRRDDDRKGKCDGSEPWTSTDGHYCGGWHSRAVHLTYIGHAGITMRLNDVLGPGGWDYHPYALGDNGLPMMAQGQPFWAHLTILGVTKWDVAVNFTSLQEAYGDALRRCAMRFGIGTYLWAKSDMARALAENADPPPDVAPRTQAAVAQAQHAVAQSFTGSGAPADPTISTADLLAEIDLYAGQQGLTRETITAKWRTTHGDMPVEVLDGLDPVLLLPLVESIRTYLQSLQS